MGLISDQIKKTLPTTFQESLDQQTTPRDYSDVELTPEEEKEALRLAREQKHTKKIAGEYWERVSKQPEWREPTARELYEGLLRTKGVSELPYKITEDNRNVVLSLCLYFANDPKFEDAADKKAILPGLSLKKGILLMGTPGVGKTHLMNYFCKNPKASFTVPTCNDVVERFRTGWTKNDVECIDYYSQPVKADAGHPFNQEYLGTCFGDLGNEDSNTNNYGNKRNVMEQIIFNRYERKYDFCLTHFTTNLDADMIRAKYGERCADRLREMCNVIHLGGQSFR